MISSFFFVLGPLLEVFGPHINYERPSISLVGPDLQENSLETFRNWNPILGPFRGLVGVWCTQLVAAWAHPAKALPRNLSEEVQEKV